MKDRAGNELAVGDRVLYLVPGRSSSWLEWGTIESFTPKKVRIIPNNHPMNTIHVREPRSVVKPYVEN